MRVFYSLFTAVKVVRFICRTFKKICWRNERALSGLNKLRPFRKNMREDFEIMKNLKKIISTVAALALSLSSFAAFAADYSDVADTSNYKEAVDAISALGIVEGYTDGTFGPEKEITRAEAAKMVVNVLGPKKTAAAESMKGTSEFDDVPGSHWASGYIAQGVALGYINGVGNDMFAPDDNVTYAQMVKMLVVAAGYDRDAQLAKGWPNGYITVANDIDLTDDVAGYANDENLTRGDAAILLYNALRTPICQIVGWEEKLSVDEEGNLITVTVPETEKLDGSYKVDYEYETLLTTYFDAYEVRGMVTDVTKGANEAKFDIKESKNFDGDYDDGAQKLGEETVLLNGLDVDSLLMTYADAIIRENKDGDYELVTVVPYGRNEIETLDAALYASYDDTNKKINFYKSATSTKVDDYELDSSFVIYVNGEKLTGTKATDIAKYIGALDTTEVKLVNTPKDDGNGKYVIDDKYDYVMLTVGAYAVVSGVEVTDTKVKVYFGMSDTAVLGAKGELVVDLEAVAEGDYDFTLVDVDGNEVDPATLAKNDVLTIFADFSTGKVEDSDYANIVVCKDVVEGRVEKAKQGDNSYWAYTIGSDEYSYYKYSNDKGSTSKLTVGDTYTLYLDAFGKVVKSEVGATSVNYGVITRVWTNTNTEVDTVRLINANGEIVNYEAKDDTEFGTLKTAYDAAAAKKFSEVYDKMVVKYKLDSKDRIYDVQTIGATYDADEEYTARSNKVGSYKLSDETVILDLTRVSKDETKWVDAITKYGSLTTTSNFVDGEDYTVVVGGTKIDGAYPFVLVVAGTDAITPIAEICVVDSLGRDTNPTDGQVYSTVAYYSGSDELQYAYFAKESDATKFAKGDMFVFTTDADGLVEEYKIVFDMSDYVTADGVKTDNFEAADYTQTKTVNSKPVTFEYAVYEDAKVATWNTDDGNVIARVGKGVLVENGDGESITVGKVISGKTNLNDKTVVSTIDLASDVNVYVYDVNARAAEQVYKAGVGALNPTFLSENFTNDGDVYDWAKAGKSYVKSVFFKTVDDEITDIMVVLPKEA